MTMAKPTGKHQYISPNTEVYLFKAYVASEEDTTKHWPEKWGWILDEYKLLKSNLNEISKKSVMIKEKHRVDNRTIFPIPNSVNHEYGWVCSKEEFRLERYGPDVPKPKPLLD